MQAAELLQQRLRPRPAGRLDIRTRLLHFGLINYAVPAARLAPYIPTQWFDIPEFEINGRALAMLSVVPFVDIDFTFYRLFPWLKFRFPQTNHRVYVTNRATGSPVVWFLGTTLGSPLVHLARALWRIPWHPARYRVDCEHDGRCYGRYRYQIESDWCQAIIDIEDTGQPVSLTDRDRLVLTHPVDGYFYRLDGRVGGYAIWHDLIPLTEARPRRLYFSLYERLGIMDRREMQQPVSVFLCPEVGFDIYMPPRPQKEMQP